MQPLSQENLVLLSERFRYNFFHSLHKQCLKWCRLVSIEFAQKLTYQLFPLFLVHLEVWAEILNLLHGFFSLALVFLSLIFSRKHFCFVFGHYGTSWEGLGPSILTDHTLVDTFINSTAIFLVSLARSTTLLSNLQMWLFSNWAARVFRIIATTSSANNLLAWAAT